MSAALYPDLKGKTVLVTGSSKALGAETARRFAASGAKVVVNGRDEPAIENVAASIRAEGGECIGVRADVTSAAELSSLQTTIRGRFGDVDVLAAFVGGLGSPVPVLDITEDQWRNTVNTDLTGKFLTVRTFASAMKEKRSGNIILMSSAAGRLVSQASAAYAASEAGTLMRQQVLHAASGRLRKKVSGKLASNSQYL